MISYNLPQRSHTAIKTLFCILFALLLSGCQSTALYINPDAHFLDQHFPGFEKIALETEADVFEIGDEAKLFVDQSLTRADLSKNRIEALANSIFFHSEMNLLYSGSANTTASQTFENKAANCLSLVIMAYGMADHANINVKFQQVDIPELWVRRDGNKLLNRHVNLRLYQTDKRNIVMYHVNSYQLDFDRRAQSMRLPVKEITKQNVLARFYNNKGADALIKGKSLKAYAYFRKAIETENTLDGAWTNLGILYKRNKHLKASENAYLQAIAINSSNLAALENLSFIYKLTQREQQAKIITAKIHKQRLSNAFYHYMLGNTAYQRQQWKQAIKHYKQAIRLNKRQNNFYFSIAKSYSQLGDVESSKRYIKLAKRYSYDDAQQLFYQSKIDKLADHN